MLPVRLMMVVFLAAVLGYTVLGRLAFTLPVSLEAAEACGFTSADFAPSGKIEYPLTQAWWLSYTRKGEYWSALCMGMACAFVAFALSAVRRLGAGVASGAAMGGGLLALGALCLGCLAPALSVVGLGIAGALLADIPKWLMALNTLLMTGWGTLFLARRLAVCPILPPDGVASVESCQGKTK